MMKQFSILATLVVAVACKADAPSPASSAPDKDGSTKARSAKIDVKPVAPATPPPALPPPAAEPPAKEPAADTAAARDDGQQRRNARMDTDGDGVVSSDERMAALRERATTFRQRLDTDGDGKVSYEELSNASSRRMRFEDPAALDTNHDGDISVDELAAGIKARRDRHRTIRGQAADPAAAGAADSPGADPQ
ncbi:MAG TPA: EF-hand domain-containing protein [Kofleriaceae bacterium]|nr:EF-hand domain-containing protein [Kofleriaceae bacterium]